MTSGVVFNYRRSWVAEGLRTSWESEWRIIDEQGSVSWDGGDKITCEVVAETSGLISTYRRVEIPELKQTPLQPGHTAAIADFVRAIQTGHAPQTICTDNIKSLAMVFGAVESAVGRKRVEVAL
jgi:predicted dehydrogenase